MEENLSCFKGLAKDIISTHVYCKLGRVEVHANPQDWDRYTEPNPPPLPASSEDLDTPAVCGHWEERLSSFQKLIMVKCFEEEKVSLITCMLEPISSQIIDSIGSFCCD